MIPGLRERVRGLESSDLISRADRLQELRADPAFRWVAELLEDARERLVQQLIRAPKSDVGEYAHLAGTITGMDIAGEVIDEVVAEARRVAQMVEAGEFRQEGE